MNPIAACVTGLQHIGLPTNDMNKTLDFYTALGFDLVHDTRDGDTRVSFLQLQNVVIETYENGQAVGTPGAINHICLDVKDVDEAWKAVTAAGFTPKEPEPRFLPFWEKGVRFFNLTGPNGEIVEYGQIL